jgi:23S rRNA pseudouridine2457 synthase
MVCVIMSMRNCRYIIFYKPFEVLSQFSDHSGRRTLGDFIPVHDVYAAGRLDYRSEGLLFLTDDGRLIQQLIDPRFGHSKTYLVQLEGIITEQAIERLNSELVLPGIQSIPAAVKSIHSPDLPDRSVPVRDYHPTSWIEIVLREGKKHQVRKMTAAVGFPTLRLVRIAVGNLKLDGLQPGQWRDLKPIEMQELRQTHKANFSHKYRPSTAQNTD